MRFPRVRSIHKYVSLSFLALWALQAASGLAIISSSGRRAFKPKLPPWPKRSRRFNRKATKSRQSGYPVVGTVNMMSIWTAMVKAAQCELTVPVHTSVIGPTPIGFQTALSSKP